MNRHLFAGAYVALAATAVAAVVFFVGIVGIPAAAKASGVTQLRDWSNGRVLAEMGEARQVAACDDLIGGPGFVARFYINERQKRLTVVCTPGGTP